MPGPNGLPVTGFGGGASPVAGGAGGAPVGQGSFSQRVGLGRLGAIFGQTLSSTGAFKADAMAREVRVQKWGQSAWSASTQAVKGLRPRAAQV
jgi:hypothetical protein